MRGGLVGAGHQHAVVTVAAVERQTCLGHGSVGGGEEKIREKIP